MLFGERVSVLQCSFIDERAHNEGNRLNFGWPRGSDGGTTRRRRRPPVTLCWCLNGFQFRSIRPAAGSYRCSMFVTHSPGKVSERACAVFLCVLCCSCVLPLLRVSGFAALVSEFAQNTYIVRTTECSKWSAEKMSALKRANFIRSSRQSPCAHSRAGMDRRGHVYERALA